MFLKEGTLKSGSILIGAMLFSVFSFLMLPASLLAADLNILFILDGSGSMWGRIDGVAKIVLAKDTMTSLISEIPDDAAVGLMCYGHRRKGDCDDIELLVPLGKNNQPSLREKIQAINPKGMTPIHLSIEKAVSHIEAGAAEKLIVLVSDGLETCDGDPCRLVESLRKKGVRFKIHVIGFDVTEPEKEQLACIAGAGGGTYFSADDASQLKDAFAVVKEEIVKTIEAEYGILNVLGTGRDLYDVYDDEGLEKLDYARTNQPIRLAPGIYGIRLQGVFQEVEVRANEETLVGSGRIRVTGLGEALYAIYDTDGNRKIDFTRTNREIELLAGKYLLELNNARQPIKIETGRETLIRAGSITVVSDGSALFAVYDAEGKHKLEFTRVNKTIEVLPGTYQVNIGDRWMRDVNVGPGEAVSLR